MSTSTLDDAVRLTQCLMPEIVGDGMADATKARLMRKATIELGKCSGGTVAPFCPERCRAQD